MFKNIAYIGIGSNLGNALQNVFNALTHLRKIPLSRMDLCSSFYRTTPVDADGDNYINAVVRLLTELSPINLLLELQKIETLFGRKRPYRNAPRTLDLDILLYNSDCINSPELSIPHPRMDKRAFVLVPLAEIAPDIHIPGKEKISVLIDHIENQGIWRL